VNLIAINGIQERIGRGQRCLKKSIEGAQAAGAETKVSSSL